MSNLRVLRIENVRFDYLQSFVEGIAVCCGADGKVDRRRLSIQADPYWCHETASSALRQVASNIFLTNRPR
ncbi:hypothetical protein SAMN05444004_10598 [Jannaschia faecimaris]|uniref:Uncharacterized protein n=1 Tax=Jannaschia faecimaris TaxID=1244108 RepID=A0A1H3PNX6_9RHOB|nr:hypothetical protein SAMN05444004_10598 [Jannaschia faecimaris]